ncbi:hypothetical protein Bca4012_086654 [Brassica carinata]
MEGEEESKEQMRERVEEIASGTVEGGGPAGARNDSAKESAVLALPHSIDTKSKLAVAKVALLFWSVQHRSEHWKVLSNT